MVRYTVKPGRGPENEDHIERVFAELARDTPPGLREVGSYRFFGG